MPRKKKTLEELHAERERNEFLESMERYKEKPMAKQKKQKTEGQIYAERMRNLAKARAAKAAKAKHGTRQLPLPSGGGSREIVLWNEPVREERQMVRYQEPQVVLVQPARKKRKSSGKSRKKRTTQVASTLAGAVAMPAQRTRGMSKDWKQAVAHQLKKQANFNHAVTVYLQENTKMWHRNEVWKKHMEHDVKQIASIMASGFEELRLSRQVRQQAQNARYNTTVVKYKKGKGPRVMSCSARASVRRY